MVSGAIAAIIAAKSARLLDMRAVDRGDHVARLDAGMGGRASGVRLLEDRAVGLHHAETGGKG